MTDDTEPRYSAPAAACAAEILLVLARSKSPLTLAQLVERTGCSRSLVYRTLKTLEERALVSEEPATRAGTSGSVYQLGVASMEIGGAYASAIPFMQSSRSVLRRLASQTGETASLAVRQGDRVLYLMREEGERSIFSVSQVGKTLPAHATGAGKALLSLLSDGELRQLYARKPAALKNPLTASTFTIVGELIEDLRKARLNGYALEDGEVVEGRCCIGAAIRFPENPVESLGISVSTSRTRFTETREQLVEHILTAREALASEAQSRSDFGDALDPSAITAQAVGGFY